MSPPQAAVFEDAEAGIDAALAGGFWTVGVGSANIHHAHVVVTSLAETTVAKVLARLNAAPARTTP